MPGAKKNPHIGILIAVTYGLVAVTTLLAVAAYFYFRSEIKPGDQADPNPVRHVMVGSVWVPVYTDGTYFEPAHVKQKAISTGTVKFRTKNPAGSVLAFYQAALQEGGFVTATTGDAGGTVQAVRSGGRISVVVTVTTSPEETTGEIHTLEHVESRP